MRVGNADGFELGRTDGFELGRAVGETEGKLLGDFEGCAVGLLEGKPVGRLEGHTLGDFEGFDDGSFEGLALGTVDGNASLRFLTTSNSKSWCTCNSCVSNPFTKPLSPTTHNITTVASIYFGKNLRHLLLTVVAASD